jgi:hypothetical protein
MSIRDRSILATLALAFLGALLLPAVAWAAPASETNCSDGKDDDGDVVFDCGDADCKGDPACQPDGQPENTPERCGDWIDNDEDSYVDCDDNDCSGSPACYGSWDVEMAGGTPGGGGVSTTSGGPAVVPPGGGDGSDLIGQGGDAMGERDNFTCNDGVDNDNDGTIDCDDLGCKLDTQVTVCQPSGDFRFSVVARVKAIGFERQTGEDNEFSTEFDALQLRILGQMPFIQNSFFLISGRVEKTPRVVFALFQVPIGKKGHYFNLNSGGGGLALEIVRSVHKRLLADPAFYVYNAFEQGNGAALEFGGPLDRRHKFIYRAFAAGGSGRFAGNVGGTFFPDDNHNYTWSVGTQAWMNLVGYFNRWDSPFLYTKVPITLAWAVGAKFDQRAQERYPAWNSQLIFRWWRFHLQSEYYGKRELVFKNWQNAYNVQLAFLPWQKRMLLAADFGQYLATNFEDPPTFIGADLRRQLGELQYRAAMHVYLWRDVFFLTAIWRDRRVEPPPGETGIQVTQDARLLFTYRW